MAFKLEANFQPTGDQPQAIKQLVQGLHANRKFQTLLGVTGSGKTFTLANVINQVQKPTLVIANNKTLAAQLCAELREFFPHNAVEFFISYYDYYQPEAYLPQTDTYIDKDMQINDEIDRMRHSATRALLTRDDVIVVASVSCIYGLGRPEDYVNSMIKIALPQAQDQQLPLQRVGFNLPPEIIKNNTQGLEQLIRELVAIQYVRNDFEVKRGHFRVRGDIIDIYPVYQHDLVRVTFWGDEVESISEVDPITGVVKTSHEVIYLYPASHYMTAANRLAAGLQSIEQELAARLRELEAKDAKLEAHRLQQRTNYDLEMIREMGFCSGIENYSRHLDGRQPGQPSAVLLDYFAPDFLLVIDESHITVPQLGSMYAGDLSRKTTLVEHGFRLPSAKDNRPLKFSEFEQKLNQVIFMSATPGRYELEHSRSASAANQKNSGIIEQIIRPTGLLDPEIFVRPAAGQVEDLIKEIKIGLARQERSLVTTLTKRMAEDLADYLSQQQLKVRYLHSEIDALTRLEVLHDLRAGVFDVLVGINLLREGLDLPEVSLVAILDADKEGFLRAERSLIQTIGRAARNVNGRVIFYAETITDSMRQAINETNRRRNLQLAYNQQHGIIPQTINKKVQPIRKNMHKEITDLSQQLQSFIHPDQLPAVIRHLETAMHQAAQNLEFEKAAVLRDELARFKEKQGLK
jgi:excinuclease ABC subunit B